MTSAALVFRGSIAPSVKEDVRVEKAEAGFQGAKGLRIVKGVVVEVLLYLEISRDKKGVSVMVITMANFFP